MLVTIFCDGACSLGKSGGFGVVAEFGIGGPIVRAWGGLKTAPYTNQRAEILAACMSMYLVHSIAQVPNQTNLMEPQLVSDIRGLMLGEPKVAIDVYTDSEYVISGITSWVQSWQVKGWLTAQGQPVKNRDLWEKLVRRRKHVIQDLPNVSISWSHVKGHSGVWGNEEADRLATRGRKEYLGAHNQSAHPHISITGVGENDIHVVGGQPL